MFNRSRHLLVKNCGNMTNIKCRTFISNIKKSIFLKMLGLYLLGTLSTMYLAFWESYLA